MDNILNAVPVLTSYGLHDLYQNETYYRLDGKRPEYIKWHLGEPNVVAEHCVGILNKVLFDIPCGSFAKSGLCQRISCKSKSFLVIFEVRNK